LNSTNSKKKKLLQIGESKKFEIKKIQKMSLGGIRQGEKPFKIG
jgi:hypothetical protein